MLTFWLVVLGVTVAGFALAWWSSGRRSPGSRRDRQVDVDLHLAEQEARSRTRQHPAGGVLGG